MDTYETIDLFGLLKETNIMKLKFNQTIKKFTKKKTNITITLIFERIFVMLTIKRSRAIW